MGHDIKIDPAIERWAHLRENTHLYFGWNKRTTTRTLVWMGIVPVALTYLAYKTQVSHAIYSVSMNAFDSRHL